MTQCELILAHLQTHGELTSLEAMERYGICRLAARVSDLRARGHDVKTEHRQAVNRYGKKISYGVYRL